MICSVRSKNEKLRVQMEKKYEFMGVGSKKTLANPKKPEKLKGALRNPNVT